MNSIYRQLCRDHRDMQQLLDTFEQLLDDLARRDRDPNTLSLILDALDYISVYPNQWHHPVEDIAFSRLLDKAPQFRNRVNAVCAEHRRIDDASRHMNRLFYTVANDAAVERECLFGSAQAYLQLQRDHIEGENRDLFPLLEQYLDASDWRAVAAQLRARQNPVYTPAMKQLYDTLAFDLAQLYPHTTDFPNQFTNRSSPVREAV